MSDRQIRVYNKRYLRHDRPTDVIAFPRDRDRVSRSWDKIPLGEILVSLDTAKRQAVELGHPLFHEIKILLIHGLLHLLGYKDKKRNDCLAIWKETEKLLGKVSKI